MLDTQITIEVVTKERIQLVNTIMSSSWKMEMNMCVCVQRKCFAEHYGDGVRDGSVSMVSFLKIRNGLGARKGENRFMDPNTPP